MRIINLDVENFGIFSHRQFQFGDGRLALVYGPNEAGKSTLLQLLRELLFGFPHRDTIPIATGSIAARATLQLRDGSLLAWQRRKGRLNTLSGHLLESGDVWDAARLEQLLCGASAELYEHVFAFSLAELQQGEKSLQSAKLTEALYGGGAGGLAAFQQIEATIDERLAKLFAPRGSKRLINERLQKVRDCAQKLREAAVKPSMYQQLASENAYWQQQRQASQQRVQHWTQQLRELECRAQILPARSRRAAILQALHELQLPSTIDVAVIPRCCEAALRLQSIEQQLSQVQRTQADRQQQRAQIELVEPLLRSADEVLHLYADLRRMAGFRRDLPLRAEEARALEEDIDRQLTRWKPDWNRDFLRQLPAGQAELKTIRKLAAALNQLELQQSEADGALRAHQQQCQDGLARLQQLIAPQLSSELVKLLEHAHDFESWLKQLREQGEQQQQLSQQLQSRRRALEQAVTQALPVPLPSDIPAMASIEQMREQLAEAERALANAQQTLAAIERRTRDGQQELQKLISAGVPTKLELYAARDRRGQLWADLQAILATPTPDNAALRVQLNEYAQAVTSCDELADRLWSAATAVAQREALTEQLAALGRDETAARQNLTRCQNMRQTVLDEWRALWNATSVEPLSPAAMLDWLRTFNEARELENKLEHLRVQQAALGNQCATFESALREHLLAAPADPLAALKIARQKIEEARRIHTERRQWEQTLYNTKRELEKIQQQLVQIQDRRTAWQSQWQTVLTNCQLPTDWTPQIAEDVLGKLFELKERLGAAQALRQRIADMQGEVDQFHRAAGQLCEQIAADLVGAPPETAVHELFRRVQQTRVNQQLASQLDADLSQLNSQQASLTDERNRLQQVLADFFSHAATTAELLKWLPQLQTANSLVAELRTLDSLLQDLGDTSSDDQPISGEPLRPDELQAQCAAARAALQHARDEHERAVGQSEVIAKTLEDLDAQGRTNELALELEKHRAELQTAVHQWAPLMLASALMTHCLERFERDRQPRLLQLASGLFQRMTDGRYLEIRRRLGDDPPTLVVQQRGGKEKDPSQLSTGTREQLYLAIRLAYVMQYCEEAEPLPLVMDDVLVNFDAHRARLTLDVLADVAQSVQIFLMTCHESTAHMVLQHLPQVTRIELGESLGQLEPPRTAPIPPRKRPRVSSSAAAGSDPQRPLFPPHS